MWSRLWGVSPLALFVTYASCSTGAEKKADDRLPSAAFGAPAGKETDATDKPNLDGPGLRGASTDSVRLPVPRTFSLTHVEARYFAAALGNDPAHIFAFVRDHIAFEPYRGCLRGPRGTLMAMAGNAVDRAALLGSLLSSAGQRVRYARGHLEESVARDLVASMWAERSSADASGTEAPSSEVKADLSRFLEGIHRDASILATTLNKAGLPRQRSAGLTREELVKEAQDHYWVEWSQDGRWTPLDPSFATSTPGQHYAPPLETFDELPDSLFHHVALRVRVEEYQGDEPTSRQLLDYSARAADLSGVDLYLSHLRVQSGQGIQLRPVLTVGQDQVIGLLYSVALPSTPGQASGALADALAGDAETAALPIASALFVDLDLVAPDGGKTTVVREIFDRIGKKRRLAGSKLTANDLAVAPEGPTRPEELLKAVYDFFITTGAVRDDHLRNISALSARPSGERPTIGDALRMVNLAFAVVSDGLTDRIADSTGRVLRTYPDGPRIYVAELSEWKGRPRLSLDLRRDQPRVAVSGFDGRRLFIGQVLHGVIAGAVEREVVGYFATGDAPSAAQWAPSMSTSLVFERAQAAKIQAVLLSGNSAALSGDVPAEARARIDEALAAGQIVVAPARSVELDGAQRLAWWRIDPSSGATTPVTDEGLNQTAEGIITRTPSGEVTLELRMSGTTFDFFRARDAEQAVHWVRNITRNYRQLNNIRIGWQGLPELWADVLLGL